VNPRATWPTSTAGATTLPSARTPCIIFLSTTLTHHNIPFNWIRSGVPGAIVIVFGLLCITSSFKVNPILQILNGTPILSCFLDRLVIVAEVATGDSQDLLQTRRLIPSSGVPLDDQPRVGSVVPFSSRQRVRRRPLVVTMEAYSIRLLPAKTAFNILLCSSRCPVDWKGTAPKLHHRLHSTHD
jgi:hypothetical protein